MTTTTTWQCDNVHCGKRVDYQPEWLMIGSKGGQSLTINNPFGRFGLRAVKSHSDMHFCSGICLIRTLFGQGIETIEREILVKHERLFRHAATHLDNNNNALKASYITVGGGWCFDEDASRAKEEYEEVEKLIKALGSLVPPAEGSEA